MRLVAQVDTEKVAIVLEVQLGNPKSRPTTDDVQQLVIWLWKWGVGFCIELWILWFHRKVGPWNVFDC